MKVREGVETSVQVVMQVTPMTLMSASPAMFHVLIVQRAANALDVPQTIPSGLFRQPIVIKLVHRANLAPDITFVKRVNILAPNARAIVKTVLPVVRRVTSLISSTISASKRAQLATSLLEECVISSARILTARSATRRMFVKYVLPVFIYMKETAYLPAHRTLSPMMRILLVLWPLLTMMRA